MGMRVFLGKGLGIDIHHGRAHILGNLGERGGQGNWIGNLQRRGVRAIGLGFRFRERHGPQQTQLICRLRACRES